MKKLTICILAVFYLCFSSGATMHLHYCMGEFVSFSLFDTNKGACSKCGMENHEEKAGCCKDIPITVKASDEYASSFSLLITPENNFIKEPIEIPQSVVFICSSFHSKPLSLPFTFSRGSSTELFLKNRNLRI